MKGGRKTPYQAAIGLLLASLILSAWATAHVASVFFYHWGVHAFVTAPLLVALNSWLSVGIFIIAHDCMHGSLVPKRPAWNRAIGQLCLTVYAGFDFDRLNRKHHLHHRHAGSEGDPDFDPRPPHHIVSWYLRFFSGYFSWTQLVFLAGVSAVYLFVFGSGFANLVVFWALPAILSSIQLFFFGTYLPHRPSDTPFADRHRARSNEWNRLTTLLTCFHFGRHHQHHQYPSVPWWRLPEIPASHSAAPAKAKAVAPVSVETNRSARNSALTISP